MTEKAKALVATKLADFASIVAERADGTDPVWFRGLSCSESHRLKPSLFRHPIVDQASELLAAEASMVGTFRHRAPPFLTRDLHSGEGKEDLEVLFIMQHYGLPTRLLDWTENPFVALYFALVKCRRNAPNTDPAVWMLRPKRLNDVSLRGSSKRRDIILTPDHESLLGYFPGDVSRDRPVAMFGVHNSTRIVAQRGVFVLFGADEKPMDEQGDISDVSIMERITIPKTHASEIFASLFQLGFTDSVVFPDLDGLAREIGYQHGY